MPEDSFGMIDCAVHPMPTHSDELRTYMKEPWRSKRFPLPYRVLYPVPTGVPPYGEFRRDAIPTSRGESSELDVEARNDPLLRPVAGMLLPGSDPDLLWRHVAERGASIAILLPLTRGLQPEADLGTAICAATNEWLVDAWLDQSKTPGQFLGTIRVNPSDPDAAAREIERWAGHPKMVQVGVPLEAHRPYGQRNYRVIWEAAARHDLPVAVHSDGGAGVEFHPTAVGFPRHHIEYATLNPLNYVYHLMSLIAEGTFERIPNLRFLFADGGHDMVLPLMWKMDTEWPVYRVETPWVTDLPSRYVQKHVRFCTSYLEGPKGHRAAVEDFWTLTDADDLLMFASHYPNWRSVGGEDLFLSLSSAHRKRVEWENPQLFYGSRLLSDATSEQVL